MGRGMTNPSLSRVVLAAVCEIIDRQLPKVHIMSQDLQGCYGRGRERLATRNSLRGVVHGLWNEALLRHTLSEDLLHVVVDASQLLALPRQLPL
jgi:hypothetical protein